MFNDERDAEVYRFRCGQFPDLKHLVIVAGILQVRYRETTTFLENIPNRKPETLEPSSPISRYIFFSFDKSLHISSCRAKTLCSRTR